MGLAACATQTTVDTAQAGTSTSAATTTVVEDSVGSTTSVAESVASTVASAETSASKLRPLGLPGRSVNEPAGEYGWTGGSGKSGWMHRVAANGQIHLVFGVSADCFDAGGDPVAVTVAGLDGLYVEPYEGSSVTFIGRRGGETTGAYALPIGDRTLCVYLTWDPAITPYQLSAGARGGGVHSWRASWRGRHPNQLLPRGGLGYRLTRRSDGGRRSLSP